MRYTVHGPFLLPRDTDGLFTREAGEKASFWETVESSESGLSDGVGAYLISVRNVVWYVGLAEKQSFRKECFSAHKVTKIDSAIRRGSGNAFLHLLAKRTPTDRIAAPSCNGYRDVQFLENSLIGISLERNPELLNRSDTAILREIKVPGLFNSPPHSGKMKSVRSLQQILGV